MVHQISVSRMRLFEVVLGMIVIAVTIGLCFFKHKEADCPVTSANRSLQLSGEELSKFFQVPPSKASMFLTAINSTDKKIGEEGPLLWEDVYFAPNNMHLGEERTHIVVEEKGLYLVFVQATFKVQNQKRENFMLRIDVQHLEEVDQFSAVFITHCGTQNCGGVESDVVLNKPILLWLEPRNNLTIVTRPWQLIDYEKRPTSTFLTIFKYSD